MGHFLCRVCGWRCLFWFGFSPDLTGKNENASGFKAAGILKAEAWVSSFFPNEIPLPRQRLAAFGFASNERQNMTKNARPRL